MPQVAFLWPIKRKTVDLLNSMEDPPSPHPHRFVQLPLCFLLPVSDDSQASQASLVFVCLVRSLCGLWAICSAKTSLRTTFASARADACEWDDCMNCNISTCFTSWYLQHLLQCCSKPSVACAEYGFLKNFLHSALHSVESNLRWRHLSNYDRISSIELDVESYRSSFYCFRSTKAECVFVKPWKNQFLSS